MRLPADGLVLDVGGWAKPLARADWVLDLLPYETRGLYGGGPSSPAGAQSERFTAETWVQRDVCDRAPWPFADGQFAYAVCSHTLEDLRDPVWVCAELSRVARAGYVEVPSPAAELTWGQHGPWVGWSHHHWICEVDGGGLVFTHKPHLLGAAGRHLPAGTAGPQSVLSIEWVDAVAAREQVLVGAEAFDPWLQRLLDAHGGPAPEPRRRFGRR